MGACYLEFARKLPAGEGLRKLFGDTLLKSGDVGPNVTPTAGRSPHPILSYISPIIL